MLYWDSGNSFRFVSYLYHGRPQSAPSSAKKGSYKKVITVSILLFPTAERGGIEMTPVIATTGDEQNHQQVTNTSTLL
jgi:hypothetical protein